MSRPEHVVLIGAGITGALVAERLLSAGVRVTVLEAREKGAGSSSRSAACIRQQFSTPATVKAMLYSVQEYLHFEERFRCDPGQGDALVQNGYLFLYADPAQADDAAAASAAWRAAQANVAMQQECGLTEVQLLTPGQIGERFVHVDPSGLIGATFCPSDGFLHPDVIYMEGFRRIGELGGVLHQQQPVVGARFDSQGQLRAVETGSGDLYAGDLFIDCTNAWSPRLTEVLGGETLPIEPLKRYLYFLQRGPSLAGEQLLAMPMTISPARAYCRPENAEQLLLGWAHHAEAVQDFDWADQDIIEPEFFHKSGLENYGMQLWMELAGSMPPLMEFTGLRATTAGFYAVTPDHNPWFGFNPKQSRLLHAVGFSGHGAMMGPFTAAAIAAMALEGETLQSVEVDGVEIDLTALRVGRELSHGEGMVI